MEIYGVLCTLYGYSVLQLCTLCSDVLRCSVSMVVDLGTRCLLSFLSAKSNPSKEYYVWSTLLRCRRRLENPDRAPNVNHNAAYFFFVAEMSAWLVYGCHWRPLASIDTLQSTYRILYRVNRRDFTRQFT